MNNIGYLLMKVSKDLRYNLTKKELTLYELTTSQWAVIKRLHIEEESESELTMRTAVEIAENSIVESQPYRELLIVFMKRDYLEKNHIQMTSEQPFYF